MYKHRTLVFPPSVFGQVKPSETAGHERLQTLHLFLSPKRCSYAYQAVELVWDASKKNENNVQMLYLWEKSQVGCVFCCSSNSDTSSLLGKQWFCKSDVCCRKMGWNWPLPQGRWGLKSLICNAILLWKQWEFPLPTTFHNPWDIKEDTKSHGLESDSKWDQRIWA